MAWIESHTVLIRHKKLILLAKELRLKPVYVLGHLHALWHTALEQQEDGDLSSWPDDLIAEYSGFNGDSSQFVSLLQKYEWLDGKLIHDWLDYAGRYLENKYRTANPELLKAIKEKHSLTKGGLKSDYNPTKVGQPNQPNLTKPSKSHKKKFDFESVWSRHPNKIGKEEARGYFNMTVQTEDALNKINKALDNYLQYVKSNITEKKYIQKGCNWFRQWGDWVDYNDQNVAEPQLSTEEIIDNKIQKEKVFHERIVLELMNQVPAVQWWKITRGISDKWPGVKSDSIDLNDLEGWVEKNKEVTH